jgi:hypothetical protein
LTKVFNTATCMRVVIVTFEISMSVECHVFPIIETGFLKTLELPCQGYLTDNWIRSIRWWVRFMAPTSISMWRAGRRRWCRRTWALRWETIPDDVLRWYHTKLVLIWDVCTEWFLWSTGTRLKCGQKVRASEA